MSTRRAPTLSYYYQGKAIHLRLTPGGSRRPTRAAKAARALREAVSKLSLAGAFSHSLPPTLTTLVGPSPSRQTAVIIPTDTFALEGVKPHELKRLRERHGVELIKEGTHDKLLVRVPAGSTKDPVELAFELSRATYERGAARAAHPNFIRAYQKLAPSVVRATTQWNLDNPGNPGLQGADVHALSAWTITRGDPDVAVAILDDGIDTLHPALKKVIRAQKDFVDGHSHARPARNDAHGTACAGIVASQSPQWKGLAPHVSLIAVRIAKDDGLGHWGYDDFDVADAIDWAWEQGAAVLSNSWSGGPPVDVLTNAFNRARTRGRQGKGAVIAVSAGNDEAPIEFPGTLKEVLTVGASNQWDERKTFLSKDREPWGSNYGRSLDILAPGVQIATTDIRGPRGYSPDDFTFTFNGTSAAAPHVAAAAALVLSVAPKLTQKRVHEILTRTADRLPGQKRWTPKKGHGRLNVYAALQAASRV